MNDKKFLNIAIIMMIYGTFMIFLIGTIYLIGGSYLFYHLEYIGLSIEEIIYFNENLMILNSIFIRFIGCCFLFVGIIRILILFYGFRNGKKWAWFITIMNIFIIFIPFMISGMLVGGVPFYTSITILILEFIAIIITTKRFFFSNGEE